jgi:diacylglycerol kinase family enzyme
MRITLMHNPEAGDAKHGKKELVAALAKAGHHATYQSTKKSDFKKALKKPTDLVLAAGGDGTVVKVACRLIDTGIPLSVLPLGTANNLARSLGFVASPEEIIARLQGGKKRAFDIGVIRGRRGTRYFFEAVGSGLFADYVRAAKAKGKKTEKISKEQEMARHVSLLHRVLHGYPAQRWKIDIDGENISGRYILWEAMNIRSVGPALYLASQAATQDGQLDFVCAREVDRPLLMEHLEARLAGKKHKFPLPIRRFRQLRIVWEGSTLHIDDEHWPRKKEKPKSPSEIEITVKPSALVILQPATRERLNVSVSRLMGSKRE